MKQKNKLTAYWKEAVLALLAVAVFCYWMFLFPFIPLMRESAQLFLLTPEYLCERIVVPGGLAQYVAEFFVQFFLYTSFSAAFYAILFLLFHWLTSRLLLKYLPKINGVVRYLLAFIPGFLMLWAAMIEYIPLTPTIAVLIVMFAMLAVPAKGKWRVAVTCILIPIVYWLTGPAAVLLVLCCLKWIPATAVIFAASIIISSHLAPYPLRQIARGIDYVWTGDKNIGTYEEMECDMLVRTQQWQKVIDKFRNPQSPAVVGEVTLAQYRAGQITQNKFYNEMLVPSDFTQYKAWVFSLDGLFLNSRFGTLTSAYMVGDIAFEMNLPMVSMRTAFEAMEFIPNHNKSGRTLRRLVQTNLITGHYDVALKYISILEETICYRSWAQKMRVFAEHPEKIKDDFYYMKSQESFANTEDKFFL